MKLIPPGITRLTVGDVTIANIEVFSNSLDCSYLHYQDAGGDRYEIIGNRDIRDVVKYFRSQIAKPPNAKYRLVIVPRYVRNSARDWDRNWPSLPPPNPRM